MGRGEVGPLYYTVLTYTAMSGEEALHLTIALHQGESVVKRVYSAEYSLLYLL